MSAPSWESFRSESMPPEKRTGFLLALLTVGAGLLFLSIPSPPKRPDRQVTDLKLPATRDAFLRSESIHAFRFRLQKGEALTATLVNSRDDVTVHLFDPAGTELAWVNSANGLYDSEVLHALAKSDGGYVLEVRPSADPGGPSHYRLEVGPAHPATNQDRLQAEAASWFSQGERFYGEESWEPAIENYFKALSVWEKSRDAERVSATRYRLGRSLLALDQPRPAEFILIQALNQARSSPIEVARLRDGIGRCRLRRGKLAEAQEQFRQALVIYRQEKFAPGEADLLGNLGVVARQQGDFARAGTLDFQAVELRKSIGGLRAQATLYHNLGELYLLQGRPEQALDLFDKALNAGTRSGSLQDQAGALRGKGTAYWQRRQVTQALSCLRESIDLFRAVGDEPGELLSLIRLGDVYDQADRLSAARWIYEHVLRQAQDSGDLRGQAMAMGNLGHVLGRQQRKEQEGLHYFERAQAAFIELGDTTPLGKIALGRAEIFRRIGDLVNARLALEDAIRRFEAFQSPSRRIAASSERRTSYELYVDVLMRLGEPARAFEAAEASRFRTLFDDIQKSRAGDQLADPLISKRASQLEDRLKALELERWRLPRDSERVKEIDHETGDLDSRLALVRRELNPQSQQEPPKPLSLKEVQRSLEPDALLLVYFLGEDRSFLWEIGRNQFQTHQIGGRSEIEDAAKRVHEELSKGTAQEWRKWTKALKTMSGLVLSPMADRLQSKLIIDPDGALNLVPFAALLDPRTLERKGRPGDGSEGPEFLVVNHETVTVPSVSLIIARREALKDRPPAPKAVAILADPVYPPDSEFPRLPYTAKEADAILEMVPRNQSFVARGFQANRATATSPELALYRILHFATHGWNRDRPDLSGVVLSLVDESGRGQDGFLRAFEIYEFDVSADLVVLSACETGIGAEEGGLVRAFLNAGSRQVMATLWRVQDGSTARLMESFYRSHLAQGMSTSAALRQAQRSFLARFPNSSPRRWAGFVLHGDWN